MPISAGLFLQSVDPYPSHAIIILGDLMTYKVAPTIMYERHLCFFDSDKLPTPRLVLMMIYDAKGPSHHHHHHPHHPPPPTFFSFVFFFFSFSVYL